MQLLIFDAKVTNSSYGNWVVNDDFEKELFETYNATLRFVATMSGLTRWQFIKEETDTDTEFEFGDFHKSAVDETWYKSAILQHLIDAESFVYSVSHYGDPKENNATQITASHAIFPRDGGLEAPACVVGFQFDHTSMSRRFDRITQEEQVRIFQFSKRKFVSNLCLKCADCKTNTSCDDHNNNVLCFVIDNNGYVLLGNHAHGKFLGHLPKAGAVMEVMIEKELFKRIEVYDYQALCKIDENNENFATSLRSVSNFWSQN